MDITALDFAILDAIASMRCSFFDWFFSTITHLADAGILWILVAVLLLFTARYRKDGLKLALALICCLLLSNLFLKNLVARPRPCWVRDVALLIANPTDYSFPSGHTQASVASALVLWRANRKWGIAAAVLTALIAFSRMYLYVHYPTDILGGVLCGLISGSLGVFLGRRLWEYFHGQRAKNKVE